MYDRAASVVKHPPERNKAIHNKAKKPGDNREKLFHMLPPKYRKVDNQQHTDYTEDSVQMKRLNERPNKAENAYSYRQSQTGGLVS